MYARIYRVNQLNNLQVQTALVAELAQLFPRTMVPILVADAGTRSDWFHAVTARGYAIGQQRLWNCRLIRVHKPASNATKSPASGFQSARQEAIESAMARHAFPCA